MKSKRPEPTNENVTRRLFKCGICQEYHTEMSAKFSSDSTICADCEDDINEKERSARILADAEPHTNIFMWWRGFFHRAAGRRIPTPWRPASLTKGF